MRIITSFLRKSVLLLGFLSIIVMATPRAPAQVAGVRTAPFGGAVALTPVPGISVVPTRTALLPLRLNLVVPPSLQLAANPVAPGFVPIAPLRPNPFGAIGTPVGGFGGFGGMGGFSSFGGFAGVAGIMGVAGFPGVNPIGFGGYGAFGGPRFPGYGFYGAYGVGGYGQFGGVTGFGGYGLLGQKIGFNGGTGL